MAMIHHAMPLLGGQTVEKQFSGRATITNGYYDWEYKIPLTDTEAAQYKQASIKDLLVHATHGSGQHCAWTYIHNITITGKYIVIIGKSMLKNDTSGQFVGLSYIDISGTLILYTKAAKPVGIQPVKCTKTNSHYAYYVFDCRGINEISINVSLSGSHVLYVCGSSDPDIFNATGNNINGTQIRMLSTSGAYVIDVSGYDYINLDFYNPSDTSTKRYNASGDAIVIGAQLLYVQ